MGENVPPKTGFLVLSQTVWVFLRKKLKNCIWYPIYQKKSYIHFCRPSLRSLKNGDAPQKLFFAYILENIVFFEEDVR